MERIAFRMRIRQDRMEDYFDAHREVWPEMLQALRDAGWRNYSLFHTPDGEVFAYLECDDFAAARSAIAATDVAKRWGDAMEDLLEPGTDPGADRLQLYFHLEDEPTVATSDGGTPSSQWPLYTG